MDKKLNQLDPNSIPQIELQNNNIHTIRGAVIQDQYQIINHEKITSDYCIMNAVSLDTQNLHFIKFSNRCE
jgi:hypothetical protein